MRTTVTLDDDLAARLKQAAHERGISFKAAINEAIRGGLDNPRRARRFTVEPRRLGPAKVDLTKALQLSAQMEDEERIRKLRRGQ
jgi:Ribbon-helix-helix protein, copG family